MMARVKQVVILAVLLSIAVEQCRGDDGMVNKIVTTALDLTGHLAKFTVSVTLENKGDQSASHMLYLIDPMLVDDLAYINAEVSMLDHTTSHDHTTSSDYTTSYDHMSLAW